MDHAARAQFVGVLAKNSEGILAGHEIMIHEKAETRKVADERAWTA
jgi:hypothetical protein